MIHFEDLSLLEPFTFKSEWWDPADPESKVRGTLTYTPAERISLELNGVFQESPPLDNLTPDRLAFIHGEDEFGRPVTLVRCFMREFGGSTMVYDVNAILFGIHTRDLSGLRFQSCVVEYNDLEEWVCYNPFRSVGNFQERGKPYGFECVEQAPQIFNVPAAGFQLQLSGAGGTTTTPLASAEIRYRQQLEIIWLAPTDWDTLRQRVAASTIC